MISDEVDPSTGQIIESWQVQRLDQLSSLIAGLAGRDDIKLQFGERWAWSARQKMVLLPKHDLVDLNRCRAIASHEVGHVLFTRHMNHLNIPSEYAALPEVFFHTMHNVYEDPRIEVAVGQVYPGAEFWLKRLHAEEEQDAGSLKDAPIPAAMQFFFAHIREFHRNWDPLDDTDVDGVLVEMLAQTRVDRISMSKLLPNTISERGMELDQACANEVDVRYPIGSGSSVLLDAVEQRKCLAQARMMQIMEGRTRDCALKLYDLDLKRIEQVLQGTPHEEAYSIREIFQKAFASPLNEASLAHVYPTERAHKILKRWYEAQRAQHGVSTEVDFRKAKKKIGIPDPRVRGRRRNRRHFGESDCEETQSLLRTYSEMREKVADQIQKMTQELQNVLRPTKATKWKDGYSSGSKVNLRRMIQREARNQGDLDFWQRKTEISKRNVAATLLIDLSGSMFGPKSEAALQGAILFWESLQSLGVSVSIAGFKRERIPILKFGDPIVQSNRKKVANMLNLVGSVNHDADAVKEAYQELIQQPADEHVLIVISDGQPVGDDAEARLVSVVEQVRKRVHLIGLGLGEGTRHVEQFYPHARGSIPVPELSRQIGAVLQKVLRRR